MLEWTRQYPPFIGLIMLQLIQQELLAHHEPRRWQHPFAKWSYM
ncbi:MAG: hypothetical protein ABS882_09420 [Lysinibacillus sp.]